MHKLLFLLGFNQIIIIINWKETFLCYRGSLMVALMFFIHYIFVGDIVSLTLPTTLSALDTPCHLYGLYNACAANPKVFVVKFVLFYDYSMNTCMNTKMLPYFLATFYAWFNTCCLTNPSRFLIKSFSCLLS